MDQFIAVYENAFSKDYCERAINFFDEAKLQNKTFDRLQTDNSNELQQKDDQYFGHFETNFHLAKPLNTEFNDIFWKYYKEDYSKKFGVLQQIGHHNNYAFKMQKTEIGGGYHAWHCESGSRENCVRLLAWMVYLNDVEEGGETEFLYQSMRVKPKQGTLVIFPAAFTHTHRGNPPLSNEKYIITGWTEF